MLTVTSACYIHYLPLKKTTSLQNKNCTQEPQGTSYCHWVTTCNQKVTIYTLTKLQTINKEWCSEKADHEAATCRRRSRGSTFNRIEAVLAHTEEPPRKKIQ